MAENRASYPRSEIEAACRKMPTFSNGIFDISDLSLFFQTISHSMSSEQFTVYAGYWRDCFSGKIPLEAMVSIYAVYQDIPKVVRVCIESCDHDKDGFIDEGEFKLILEMLLVHDPLLPKVDFQDFVSAADSNKDGKVSIDEAVEWFNKNVKN